MHQWEYLCIEVQDRGARKDQQWLWVTTTRRSIGTSRNTEFEQLLNRWGAEGWEFVGFRPGSDLLVFKRPTKK
jgi:hypothetical protein